MRSRVVAKVIRKHARHTTAQSAIVICQPFALLPCPNFATSGSVNPPTMSCASIAATKRYDDSFVRSAPSPVITPLIAEYGVLFAEYSVMSKMFVRPAQSSLPGDEKFGTVYASTITTAHGTAVHNTHGRNLPQRVF